MLPIDSEGVEFDVTKHNLLDDPARPQYSKTGKFVKVRKDNPNTEDLIERFMAACELQPPISYVEAKEAIGDIIEVELQESESITFSPEVVGVDVKAVGSEIGAEVIIENETTVTFRKGAVAACVNPKGFKTNADLKRKLGQFGVC